MKIKLKRKWMSHVKGEVMDLQEAVSQRLIRQGTASLYEEPIPSKKDKMVKDAPKKK